MVPKRTNCYENEENKQATNTRQKHKVFNTNPEFSIIVNLTWYSIQLRQVKDLNFFFHILLHSCPICSVWITMSQLEYIDLLQTCYDQAFVAFKLKSNCGWKFYKQNNFVCLPIEMCFSNFINNIENNNNNNKRKENLFNKKCSKDGTPNE